MEHTPAWDDSMVGEQAVHDIWAFAKDVGPAWVKAGGPHARDPQVRTTAPHARLPRAGVDPPPGASPEPAERRLLGHEFLAEKRRRLRTSATAAVDPLAAGGTGHPAPTGRFSPRIDLRPHLPTVSAAAEHALWQRIPRSARAGILPGTAVTGPEPGRFRLCHATDASTVATGINRLIRTLEAS